MGCQNYCCCSIFLIMIKKGITGIKYLLIKKQLAQDWGRQCAVTNAVIFAVVFITLSTKVLTHSRCSININSLN